MQTHPPLNAVMTGNFDTVMPILCTTLQQAFTEDAANCHVRACLPSRHRNRMTRQTSFSFHLDRGAAGLQALQADWQALVELMPDADPLHRPEWAAAHARHLAADAEALVWASARQDGRLVAVLPLEQVGPRHLRLLTSDHLYLADVAAIVTPETLWPAWWHWLQHDAGLGWTRLDIGRLREGSWLAEALRLHPPAHDFHAPLDGSAWLDCSRPYDELLRAATSKHRSNLKRGAEKAAQKGSLRYETHTSVEALAAALPHYLAVEASGWKGQQGTAVACRPEWQAFYTALTETLGGQHDGPSGCEIDLLWLGDEPVATLFWLRAGRTLALQKIAYREDLSAIGPGQLALAHALRRACEDPTLARYSFITRCTWADGWRSTVTPVSGHVIYVDSARGHLMAWARRGWHWFKAAKARLRLRLRLRLRRPAPFAAAAVAA